MFWHTRNKANATFQFLFLRLCLVNLLLALVGRGFITNPGFERRFRWRGSVLRWCPFPFCGDTNLLLHSFHPFRQILDLLKARPKPFPHGISYVLEHSFNILFGQTTNSRSHLFTSLCSCLFTSPEDMNLDIWRIKKDGKKRLRRRLIIKSSGESSSWTT